MKKTAENLPLQPHDPVSDQASLDTHLFQDVCVLVVEDAQDNQFLIRRFLEKEGIQVDIANDGQQGFEKALQGNYDLVLMDIQMPILDGYRATSQLRATGYSVPIVAFTAHAVSNDKESFLRMGFNDLLAKPVKKADLIAAVYKFKKINPMDPHRN